MTVQDVSTILRTSWGLIKEIDKKYLGRKYKSIDLKGIQFIAIDEFSIRKGHNYMTVVMDLITKRVIFVNKGRQADSLTPFFKRLKRLNIAPKAIAMDMWPAYISAVLDHFPGTPIVFDRFHIERNLNQALSDIRKAIFRDEVDLNNRKLIKGTRWLLLKNNQNLNEGTDEKKRLEMALAINKPLAAAYYLKEELKLLWRQRNVNQAKQFLGEWVAKAIASGIKLMVKFAHSLLAHRTGIFNWFENQISTGPLEGTNNKIKVLKRKAYGYRDLDYFILKIYNLHANKYPLL
jgi:transposase